MLTQLVMTHQLVLYVRSPLLWLFEAQDNEVIDKLLDHLTFSLKKGMMRQLLLTACFWATVWLTPAVYTWKIVLGHSYKSFVGAI